MNLDIYTIKKLLFQNSMVYRKNNIKHSTALNNIQYGGSNNLNVRYNDHKYIFERSFVDEDHYILSSTDNEDCVNVIISKKDKIAEIHGIKNYPTCLYKTNQNVGSTLLKITLKMLNKYKNQFNINMITLTDNSIKRCKNTDIPLSIMLTMLTGDTWYGKYGFRPINISNYTINEVMTSNYEKNKKRWLTITISEANLLYYINMTKNADLIKATEKILKMNPKMLLKDYLSKLLSDYDVNCKYFSCFYEKLYYNFSLFEPRHQIYGLKL